MFMALIILKCFILLELNLYSKKGTTVHYIERVRAYVKDKNR